MATAAHDERFSPAAARSEWARQVNLVRKQEFAYLRSVQKREAGEGLEPTLVGIPARASTAGTVRGDTLKKIDEIEAQLDLLWVASRGKHADSVFPFGPGFAAESEGADEAAKSKGGLASKLQAAPGVLTQIMHHTEMPSSVLLVASLEEGQETFFKFPVPLPVPSSAPTGRSVWSGPTLAEGTNGESAAVQPDRGPHCSDAILTTSAALFACAEYDLAAQHLIRGLDGKNERGPHGLQRLLGLLEIYRATGNQARFDWSVLEYFDYWDGRTPQWNKSSDLAPSAQAADQTALYARARSDAPQAAATRAWRCPSTLNRAAAQALRSHWECKPDCTIDWTSVRSIHADAAAELTEVITAAMDAPEQIVFQDTPNLLHVLERLTPQGQAQTARSLWNLRFVMLRLMNRRAAFDAASADFCMTYIEQPPVWRDAKVGFVDETMRALAAGGAIAPSTAPWRLQGHVEGANGLTLPELPSQRADERTIIACGSLVRMDPSACTQLLQWLKRARLKKANVHLQGVSLLVGAAWATAGVGAYAQVHLRELP